MRFAPLLLISCAITGAPANVRAGPVGGYGPVFEQCQNRSGEARLAIRRMNSGGQEIILTVEPQSLATALEPAKDWACEPTDDAAQAATRYLRAVDLAPPPPKASAAPKAYLQNAGLRHGAGAGAFVTGDLCPSGKPLDRSFFELLAAQGRHTPVALSISGLWLTHHEADFAWLQDRTREGAIDITWVNHSWRHPYAPGVPFERNFLLTPGVDMDAEVFKTEKLLIEHGETPSVFFRFPGLISNPALMEALRRFHLIALGADSWLAIAPPARALPSGAIVLVHPNGNEPQGLKLFARSLQSGNLKGPFLPLDEAP